MAAPTSFRAVYKRLGEQEIDLDVYLPPLGPSGTKYPAIINIHGGAFMLGSSDLVNKDQVQDCLDRGWIVLVPNHRLCPQVNLLEGPMRDCRDLLAWIHDGGLDRAVTAHAETPYAIDYDAILAFGTSSGGTLALSLPPSTTCTVPPTSPTPIDHALTPSRAPLSTDLPPSFFQPMWDQSPVPTRGVVSLEGQTVGGAPDFNDPRQAFAFTQIKKGAVLDAIFPSRDWAKVDPLLNVTSAFPPTVLVHGDQDVMVPLSLSRDLHEALRRQGVRCELVLVEGEGHTFAAKMKMTKDDKDKASLRHIDTTVTGDADNYGPKGGVTMAEVNSISAWQSIKLNPKIVFWSLFANIGSIVVGYENLALAVCLAMPAFQHTFAVEVNGVFIIPASWQAAWNAMYNVMIMFGGFFAGYVQDALGRRAVFMLFIPISVAGIAIAFVSNNAAHFLGAKIVTGFAVGLILTTTQTYISEIAPLPMRSIALSANTVMMNLGFLIAISATFSRVAIMNESAFRVVFAAAWAFPAILALGARDSLVRLHSKSTDVAIIDARFREIVDTVESERRLAASSGQASFMDTLRGTNWRRTRIIFICFYMPQVVGAVLSANAPYFLNQTGLESHTVIMIIQVGISAGVVSALLNFFLLTKFRHRPLMFSGVGLCVIMYLIMGIFGTMERTPRNLLAIGIALQFTSLSYGPAVGASMAVAGEVSSSRLRSKSLGIGTGWQFLASTVWTIILPYLFNQDQANLGGNIGWIFFGQGLLMLLVMFFDVPGTKGRTYEELDIMFEKKISARKFEKFSFEEEQSHSA
ncbi:unnamed protein product [Parascedosporium putredinis]|uniref:Major facilitator superfamily (MFS) profile domain-containing protein n=1 Tax=Parascedosporium putredinis TaxID=1442378 RepID=A0A9P1M7J0_9PEZI|nr:unnamed protein product [Parascedosporium putredinis]CAI7991782.1 unnamed protein product [Parascedosporium putredinis]